VITSPKIPITVFTLTFNEARQLRAVMESVKWADEIIVVDSFSTDGTVEIAREYGAKIISEKFCGFGKLRNFALDAAKHDWILSIDSDERCTPELMEEIRRELGKGPSCDAYHVPRKSHFLGHWIRHCGWYPDYRQPQFFNRKKMHYADELVHETYVLDGRLGYLKQHALQYPWDTLEIAAGKLQRYSTLMARRYDEEGKKASLFKILVNPVVMFWKTYVHKLGFLDGSHGLILAGLYGYYTFLKHAKLWELQKTRGTVEPGR
jgi:glycosyltransferase involved in cell wall biosynthesis